MLALLLPLRCLCCGLLRPDLPLSCVAHLLLDPELSALRLASCPPLDSGLRSLCIYVCPAPRRWSPPFSSQRCSLHPPCRTRLSWAYNRTARRSHISHSACPCPSLFRFFSAACTACRAARFLPFGPFFMLWLSPSVAPVRHPYADSAVLRGFCFWPAARSLPLPPTSPPFFLGVSRHPRRVLLTPYARPPAPPTSPAYLSVRPLLCS